MKCIFAVFLTVLILNLQAVAQSASADVRTGCRQALNRRLFQDNAGRDNRRRDNRGARIQSRLRNVRDRYLSDRQVALSGEAEVSIDNEPWQTITFECIYNTWGDFAESATYGTANYGDNSDRNPGGNVGGGGLGSPRPGMGRGINFDALPGFPLRRGGRGGNEIDLRLQVDGMIDIFIRGDQLRYEVINGQPPSDLGTQASVLLPRRELECQVERLDGRAQILIIEQPSRTNNFTLHLQINDRDGGSDRYRARINW